jgi:hypothetical protein
MKIVQKLGVFIILILIIIGYFNTLNFYMGSNSMFYKTIFDYPGSVWISKEPQLKLEVFKQSDTLNLGTHAIMRYQGTGNKKREFVVTGGVHLDVFDINHIFNENGKMVGNYTVMVGYAKYKKNIFGKITSFTLLTFNKDELFHNKYKEITFYRK